MRAALAVLVISALAGAGYALLRPAFYGPVSDEIGPHGRIVVEFPAEFGLNRGAQIDSGIPGLLIVTYNRIDNDAPVVRLIRHRELVREWGRGFAGNSFDPARAQGRISFSDGSRVNFWRAGDTIEVSEDPIR